MAATAVAKRQEPASANSPRVVFHARGLVKTYGVGDVQVHAPQGVDIDLFDGEFVVILGPPGGGKSTLEVVIDVLSSDAAMIHVRDLRRFAEWSGGNSEGATRVVGGVREIQPAGFTKMSALGVEEQQCVNVIADVETPPRTIGDGFRVEATIVVRPAPNVVVIPRSALRQPNARQSGGRAWSVCIVRDGRVSRTVRIGHLGAATAEVRAGIKAGDDVVLFPSDRVTPGTRVSTRKSVGA